MVLGKLRLQIQVRCILKRDSNVYNNLSESFSNTPNTSGFSTPNRPTDPALVSPRYRPTYLLNQFLIAVDPSLRIKKLRKFISKQFQKLYPQEGSLEIFQLRDANNCDLDESYHLQDLLQDLSVVQVIGRLVNSSFESFMEHELSIEDVSQVFETRKRRFSTPSRLSFEPNKKVQVQKEDDCFSFVMYQDQDKILDNNSKINADNKKSQAKPNTPRYAQQKNDKNNVPTKNEKTKTANNQKAVNEKNVKNSKPESNSKNVKPDASKSGKLNSALVKSNPFTKAKAKNEAQKSNSDATKSLKNDPKAKNKEVSIVKKTDDVKKVQSTVKAKAQPKNENNTKAVSNSKTSAISKESNTGKVEVIEIAEVTSKIAADVTSNVKENLKEPPAASNVNDKNQGTLVNPNPASTLSNKQEPSTIVIPKVQENKEEESDDESTGSASTLNTSDMSTDSSDDEEEKPKAASPKKNEVGNDTLKADSSNESESVSTSLGSSGSNFGSMTNIAQSLLNLSEVKEAVKEEKEVKEVKEEKEVKESVKEAGSEVQAQEDSSDSETDSAGSESGSSEESSESEPELVTTKAFVASTPLQLTQSTQQLSVLTQKIVPDTFEDSPDSDTSSSGESDVENLTQSKKKYSSSLFKRKDQQAFSQPVKRNNGVSKEDIERTILSQQQPSTHALSVKPTTTRKNSTRKTKAPIAELSQSELEILKQYDPNSIMEVLKDDSKWQ